MPDYHPFDRYSAVTDFAQLMAASARPLRKCVRVNTLKLSVDAFTQYAAENKWELEPVSWCEEGFFVDRFPNVETSRRDVSTEGKPLYKPLGKDLLHLLGHIYVQEASSMLPVALLDPQPGEWILDMSAAPGSKTSQIAARMQNTGLVMANDVQEKRLHTLKSALNRLGVVNHVMTKKPGQWFAVHMTERFDRVLCDAPCTAQGTVRKDPSALDYCSQDNIDKMARTQFQLLESAIHATKVGGRIVYSTCTLTPEENEAVVAALVERYPTALRLEESLEKDLGPRNWDLGRAVQDSDHIQQHFLSPKSHLLGPMLRIWPHTYDTEGFFCAVLEKTAPTLEPTRMEYLHFHEKPLRRSEQKAIAKRLEAQYGTSFLNEGDQLFQLDSDLFVTNESVASAGLPVKDFSIGLPFGKLLSDGIVRISNELVTARGQMATVGIADVEADQLQQLLDGKDIDCSDQLKGDVIIRSDDRTIGVGLAKAGRLKNRLPRWVVQHGK